MIKIGAIDSLTKDRIIKLADCEKAREFLQQDHILASLATNDKMILSQADYEDFAEIAAECVSAEHIGGSAFNTCATIAAAMPDKVQVDFITPPSSNKSELSASENFKFLPADPPLADAMISRISYICLDHKGNKYVLKYLGNIYEFLNAHGDYLKTLKAAITQTIHSARIFFLPGGIAKKFPHEIYLHILKETEKSKAKLVFALPTHSDFTSEEIDLQRRALAKAWVVLGNADEMKNTVGLMSNLTKLAATSFITDGKRDAYIVRLGRITRVSPLPLPGNVRSLTGAGDAAYAGFLVGLLRGQPATEAAQIAMVFANQVLQVLGPRLPEPHKFLFN